MHAYMYINIFISKHNTLCVLIYIYMITNINAVEQPKLCLKNMHAN